MKSFKCIDKIRNSNGKIINYRLSCVNGEVISMQPSVLKDRIRSGSINVINLKLTSDGRIIDAKNTDSKKQSNNKASLNKTSELLEFANKLVDRLGINTDIIKPFPSELGVIGVNIIGADEVIGKSTINLIITLVNDGIRLNVQNANKNSRTYKNLGTPYGFKESINLKDGITKNSDLVDSFIRKYIDKLHKDTLKLNRAFGDDRDSTDSLLDALAIGVSKHIGANGVQEIDNREIKKHTREKEYGLVGIDNECSGLILTLSDMGEHYEFSIEVKNLRNMETSNYAKIDVKNITSTETIQQLVDFAISWSKTVKL